MQPPLRYPVYLIANAKGVLVGNANGKDCVLLFHRKELAVKHIADAAALGATTPLYPLAIPDAEAFRQGLEGLPADITCAIWDVTVVPCTFVYMELEELFMVLEED